jgi:hypothetical protein
MLEKLKQTDRPPVLGEKNRNRPLVGPNFSRAFRVKYFFPGRSLGCLLRNEGKKDELVAMVTHGNLKEGIRKRPTLLSGFYLL